MRARIGLLIASTLLALSSATAAEPLPRQPFLGAAMTQVPQGLRIDRLSPAGMAAAMGLHQGDILTELAGKPLTNVPTVAEAIAATPIGRPLRAAILRDGRLLHLSARQAPRAPETYPNSDTHYGQVDIGPTRLRDVLVVPRGVTAPPVVYLMQGYSCTSIEAFDPDSLYAKLAQGFAAANIAFYRVEKPGLGDSRGGAHCRDESLAQEIAGFRAAYQHLIALGFPADRIFILGHSLGGIEAPLAVEGLDPPRGIIPYGIVLKNWADYMQDIGTFQGFAMSGDDPVAAYKQAELDRPIVQAFFFARRAPSAIAADHPGYGDRMKEIFGWDGGDHAFGRSWTLLQDLPTLDLPEAWSKVPTNVLSLYGATDEVALTGEDQARIADIVNYYRPGTATYVELPGTMHGMDLVGGRNAFRERNVAAGTIVAGPFNPEITRTIVEWIRACMAKPPVRGQSFPDSLAERVKRQRAAQ